MRFLRTGVLPLLVATMSACLPPAPGMMGDADGPDLADAAEGGTADSTALDAAPDSGPDLRPDAPRSDTVDPEPAQPDVGPADSPPPDAAPRDAPTTDAAATDSTATEASPPDAAPQDSAPPDSNRLDAAPDTTVPDTTVPDTTAPDTTAPDSTSPDTTVPDTIVPDTTRPDTILPDVATLDTALPDTSAPDTATPDTMPDSRDAAPPSDVLSGSLRLVAPSSTVAVTSRRPTLRWELPAGVDGARVELCRERTCLAPIAVIDASGSSVRPTEVLPQGVLFWRAFARRGGVVSTAPSHTWQFHVGARDTPVDSTLQPAPDLNGDGFADVLRVRRSDLEVHYGGPGGLSPSRVSRLGAPAGSIGFTGLYAGDLDGDGYGDLVIRGSGCAVHRGGPSGVEPTPAFALPGTRYCAPVGDIDRDGFADVASATFDTVTLHRGGATGLTPTPGITVALPAVASVRPLGDVNGDGYADIACTTTGPGYFYTSIQVHRGGPAGLEARAILDLRPTLLAASTWVRAVGADLQGDGFADLVALQAGVTESFDPFSTRAEVLVTLRPGGTPALVASSEVFSLRRTAAIGLEIAEAGDVNRDGYQDLVVTLDGVSRVYLGSPAGPRLLDGWSAPGEARYTGDTQGDGFDDLVTSNALYAGGATGPSATPLTF